MLFRSRLIIVADAEYPFSKRAKAALLERLAVTRVPVLQLAQTGSLSLRFAADGLRVNAVDGTRLAQLSRPD